MNKKQIIAGIIGMFIMSLLFILTYIWVYLTQYFFEITIEHIKVFIFLNLGGFFIGAFLSELIFENEEVKINLSELLKLAKIKISNYEKLNLYIDKKCIISYIYEEEFR